MSKNQPILHILATKKLNLMPTKSRFRFRCRDKIEPNLQSQNVRRTHSNIEESRFQRGYKHNAKRATVKRIGANF